ncbi:hypothetical protein Plhal703r1_c12g0063811 [Plasmopara halstedii]
MRLIYLRRTIALAIAAFLACPEAATMEAIATESQGHQHVRQVTASQDGSRSDERYSISAIIQKIRSAALKTLSKDDFKKRNPVGYYTKKFEEQILRNLNTRKELFTSGAFKKWKSSIENFYMNRKGVVPLETGVSSQDQAYDLMFIILFEKLKPKEFVAQLEHVAQNYNLHIFVTSQVRRLIDKWFVEAKSAIDFKSIDSLIEALKKSITPSNELSIAAGMLHKSSPLGDRAVWSFLREFTDRGVSQDLGKKILSEVMEGNMYVAKSREQLLRDLDSKKFRQSAIETRRISSRSVWNHL